MKISIYSISSHLKQSTHYKYDFIEPKTRKCLGDNQTIHDLLYAVVATSKYLPRSFLSMI